MTEIIFDGTPDNGKDAAQQVANEMVELIAKKQHDYGHENINAFGEVGVLVRLNDKVARLRNLIMKNVDPANEATEDSWRDVVGYGLIALMLRKGTFNLPLREE